MISIYVPYILFTCRMSVTNIQNAEAFVKGFVRFSWIVRKEKDQPRKEKSCVGEVSQFHIDNKLFTVKDRGKELND